MERGFVRTTVAIRVLVEHTQKSMEKATARPHNYCMALVFAIQKRPDVP